MADIQFSHGMGAYGNDSDGTKADEYSSNSLTFMTNIAGALVSLALIAGVGVWGYKLMVRDVSGVPVVRAVAGEMRVRPETPGGQMARHQGLAVNAVAAEGQAAGPVDSVMLAPQNTDLAQEDQPIRVTSVAPVTQPAPLAPASETFGTDKAPQTRLSQDLQNGDIDAVVAELIAGTDPLGGLSEPPENVSQTEKSQRTVARPKLRPANIATLQAAAFVPNAPASEIDAASIPAGTRLVQLGAFDSADVARAEWARLDARFGDYMQDKSRVVQEAQSGGRIFYRLRAMGFVDLGDARRFCSAFKAEGVDCIPVAVK
ncbi:hypothetical protein ROLI_019000 [Roseobacter fucihabitans]|uniref:SPOR domain-containing protein n=1 Tax=Roseobacter fucihabitans TaxID=1537242 RepID=A0ABZ2BTT3_9RHOB|nr:SPOR domain-containing protein [Roseobacter litoralis]MBC6967547.1 Sporulation related domain protein [Roseobacter litoralis]